MPPTTMFGDHASTYAEWSAINPFNRDYDRPTILRLAGDINRKRVLELGCASGVLTTPSFGPACSIDVIVASLVLHYIADWGTVLQELHRCLKRGGALVFSLHHPIKDWALSEHADYHRVELGHENGDARTSHSTSTVRRSG